MKYQKGATVILLDTTFRAVCSAKIKNVNSGSLKYEVEYIYPGTMEIETIWVPQERLTILNNSRD